MYKEAYSEDLTFENFNPKITEKTYEKLNKVIDFLYNNKFVKTKIKAEDLLTTKYYELYIKEK